MTTIDVIKMKMKRELWRYLTFVIIIIHNLLSPSLACVCGQGEKGNPWTVAILTQFGQYKTYACGGSLINDRYILTAARCVKMFPPEMILVTIGARRANETTSLPPLPVSRVIIHEKYARFFRRRRKHVFNDIALLRLRDPLQRMDGVFTPVCLPFPPFTESTSTDLFVSGWAQQAPGGHFPEPPLLIESPVKEFDAKSCSRFYASVLRFDTPGVICAGGIQGVCFKDEGSPLLTNVDGNVYQRGLVSVSRGFADCSYRPKVPTIFERVSKHLEWIKNNTNDAMWCWMPGSGGAAVPIGWQSQADKDFIPDGEYNEIRETSESEHELREIFKEAREGSK